MPLSTMAPAPAMAETAATPTEAASAPAETTATPTEATPAPATAEATATPAVPATPAEARCGHLRSRAVLLRRLIPHLGLSLETLNLGSAIDLRRRPILLRRLVALHAAASERHNLRRSSVLLRSAA